MIKVISDPEAAKAENIKPVWKSLTTVWKSTKSSVSSAMPGQIFWNNKKRIYWAQWYQILVLVKPGIPSQVFGAVFRRRLKKRTYNREYQLQQKCSSFYKAHYCLPTMKQWTTQPWYCMINYVQIYLNISVLQKKMINLTNFHKNHEFKRKS